MPPRAWFLAVSLVCFSCHDSGCGAAPAAKPAAAAHVTFSVDSGFESDDAGRPILAHLPSGLLEGYDVALVYDKNLDDPVARFGECAARVVACVDANRGNPIDGCIPLIERCPDDTGGFGCCPPSCLDAYARRRSVGDTEQQALQATLLHPSCVTGLAEQLAEEADAGVQP